jgi:hypothetical protein
LYEADCARRGVSQWRGRGKARDQRCSQSSLCCGLVGKFRRDRLRGSKVYVANFLSNNASVIDE